MRWPIGNHHGQRIGRLLVTGTRQRTESPLLDGCSSTDDRGDKFGGIAIRSPWSTFAVVVAWRGARMWGMRKLTRHARARRSVATRGYDYVSTNR